MTIEWPDVSLYYVALTGYNFCVHPPKILVTGASGFIGRQLIAHLAQSDSPPEILAVSRSGPDIAGAQNHFLDLTDEIKLGELIAGERPTAVYHLAGSSRVTDNIGMPEYFEKNFLTTVSLINGLKKLTEPVSVFLASSVHVYGNQPGAVTETSPIHPVSIYGFTKFLAEEALRELTIQRDSVRVVVGRLSSCVGPGQPEGFVASDLCRKIARLNGGPQVLNVGPLSGYRRFLDIRDGVGFLPELLHRKGQSRFEIYNLASPHELQIRTVLETLLKIANKSPKVQSSEDIKSNKLTGLSLNLEKMERALPHAHYRPIERTLQEMYEWVVSHPGD